MISLDVPALLLSPYVIIGLTQLSVALASGSGRAASPQLTAFFTSAPIRASSAALNSFSAKAVGHMTPSSRFASCMKPNVAYLVLNFCALWKKQTTLPSLAYAGIPYQSLGDRAGALALMIAWSRSPMARSGSGISAIFASTALSPSALSARGPRRADAFSSWWRSFIAARSSSVHPSDVLSTAVLLADFGVSFIAGFLSARSDGDHPHSREPLRRRLLRNCSGVTWVGPATISRWWRRPNIPATTRPESSRRSTSG